MDPDGDGQNNLFEFIAGTDPTNQNSSFDMGIMDASHATATISLTPAFSNRTYGLYRSEDLLAPSSWVHITNVSKTFVGQTLYITDLAPIDRAFYKVGIIYVGQ